MSKAVAIFVALLTVALAELPPVPDVGHGIKQKQVLDSCKVPAQIVVIPPQVEPDYRDCANRYFKPDIRDVEYGLKLMLKKSVAIKKVEVANHFLRAYEVEAVVDSKTVRFLCDEKVNRCFEITKIYEKPNLKDKK